MGARAGGAGHGTWWRARTPPACNVAGVRPQPPHCGWHDGTVMRVRHWRPLDVLMGRSRWPWSTCLDRIKDFNGDDGAGGASLA